jgi:hypothetical protein
MSLGLGQHNLTCCLCVFVVFPSLLLVKSLCFCLIMTLVAFRTHLNPPGWSWNPPFHFICKTVFPNVVTFMVWELRDGHSLVGHSLFHPLQVACNRSRSRSNTQEVIAALLPTWGPVLLELPRQQHLCAVNLAVSSTVSRAWRTSLLIFVSKRSLSVPKLSVL